MRKIIVGAQVSMDGVMQAPAIDPAQTTLDPKKIDAVLGGTGSLGAGVYKVVIGRTTRMHGHEMGAAMGVNTWAAFSGSDETSWPSTTT